MDCSSGSSNPGVAPPTPEGIQELEERLRRSGRPLFDNLGPPLKQPRLENSSSTEVATSSPSDCSPRVSPAPDAPAGTQPTAVSDASPTMAPMQAPDAVQPLVQNMTQWQDLLARERMEKEKFQAMLQAKDRELAETKGQFLKLRDAFVAQVRRSCVADREHERQEAHHKFFTLGQVIVQRDLTEIWCDGKVFRDVRAKQERLRAELEQAKKQLQDRRKEERRQRGRAATDEDEYMDEELFSLQLLQNNLQKEDAAIQTELEDLEVQKQTFIKDIKRIRNEDASKFNNCPILNDRYLLERLLGKGGFSEVYKAYDLVEGRLVACKIHQLNSTWSDERKQNYLRHARREYTIHKTLIHPCVVQLYDMFEIDEQAFATILEYCDGMDLDLYLKRAKCIPEKEAAAIIYQVFCGLKYLNERPEPVIHYDLKPGNILISSNMKVKITDFGLSKIIPSQDETHIDLTSQGAGTYWYLPPECFDTSCIPKISAKVDVWGAAVVYYQMLFGRKPFGNDVSQQQLVRDRIILNAHSVDFPPKPSVTNEAKDFIRRLLSHNSNERPDVFAVCADPYFTTKALGRRRQSAASATPVSGGVGSPAQR